MPSDLTPLEAIDFSLDLIRACTGEELEFQYYSILQRLGPLEAIGVVRSLIEACTEPSYKSKHPVSLLLNMIRAMQSPITSPVDRTRHTKTFRQFPRLPTELQQKIWLFTFLTHRRLPLDVFNRREQRSPFRGAPPPYSMDEAGQEFALQHYAKMWDWVDGSQYPYSWGVQSVFFHPKKDYLTLPFETLVRADTERFAEAHESVIFLLEDNPKREIIEQVEILEILRVGNYDFGIPDIAIEALNILFYFPALKELRLLDVPLICDQYRWHLYRSICLRLAHCFTVLERPKITIRGEKVYDVELHYQSVLKEMQKKKPLRLEWERKDSMLRDAE